MCERMGRRYTLSKRDRKKILSELTSKYPGLAVSEESAVEIYEDRELGRILIIDGIPAFFQYRDMWLPHLKFLLNNPLPSIPVVVVDSGAVDPLLRGADVMAPGIREIRGEFRAGDPVVVVEESYGKPIVVGVALMDSASIVSGLVKKGKVVENVHRIGDKLWSLQF